MLAHLFSNACSSLFCRSCLTSRQNSPQLFFLSSDHSCVTGWRYRCVLRAKYNSCLMWASCAIVTSSRREHGSLLVPPFSCPDSKPAQNNLYMTGLHTCCSILSSREHEQLMSSQCSSGPCLFQPLHRLQRGRFPTS